METISNGLLQVEISPIGAEVQSLKDLNTGHEYLWQGDARWWHGRSPILFPIVGGMWNGVCRIDGKEVKIPKHGFVRNATWTVAERKADSIRFEFTSTVGTFAIYPFAFRVAVTYSLNGRKLLADFEVKNLGSAPMWFQIGGHPAIALPEWNEGNKVDGYLKLEGNPQYVWRAGEQGCLEPDKHPVPFNAEGLVDLSVETFSHEALIFDEHQVNAATVLNLQHKPVARIESTSPAWLFWSPQGVHTPFICAEPWYGLCDHQQFNGPVEERPYINHVLEGESWTGGYSVEVF